MPIRWTKTHRKKLSGVRHPHRSDPPVLSARDAFAALGARYTAALQVGCAITAEPAHADLLASVTAPYAGGEPPDALDVNAELLRLAVAVNLGGIYRDRGRPEMMRLLAAGWVGAGGAPFAARLLEAAAPFGVGGWYSGDTCSLTVTDASPTPHSGNFAIRVKGVYWEHDLWPALRARLFALGEADYAAGLAAAQPTIDALAGGRESDDQKHRAHLMYAFSRDPAPIEREVRAFLEGLTPQRAEVPAPRQGHLLIAAMTDPELSLAFAQRWGSVFAYALYNRAYDVVEALGVNAIPVLEALAEARGVRSRQKRPLLAAAKLARTGL